MKQNKTTQQYNTTETKQYYWTTQYNWNKTILQNNTILLKQNNTTAWITQYNRKQTTEQYNTTETIEYCSNNTILLKQFNATLSGRISRWYRLACWRLQGRFPSGAAPIYTMPEKLRGYCPWGWGCDKSIGFTVSDAIVRSWLWSTATRSSPLGYFSNYCK